MARLLKVSEVTEVLGIDRRTLYRLVERGQFPPPLKVGHGSRWKECWLNDYLARAEKASKARG